MAFPRQETAAAAVGGTPGRAVALAALAGVLPFWSLLVAHVVHGRHGPAGFIVYDMAYYVANGREIFERGNGLGYCNPYDTSVRPRCATEFQHRVGSARFQPIGLSPG